jgi:hypothetical protein
MRLDLSHAVFAAIVGFAGWWIGRNVPMPGDED